MITLCEPMLSDFKPYSVAWVLQRYSDEMNGAEGRRGIKPLGSTHLYALRLLQRLPIGRKDARKLKKQDVFEHCQLRIETVMPATINQDICYLHVALSYAPSKWEDCEDISAGAIDAAMPLLQKYNLLGKARPRSRRPNGDELKRLMEYFREQDQRSDIPMEEITEFALWSARRRGEITRLLLEDVNEKKRTCIVRDMKDPKHKKGNDHEFPLLGRAWELVEPRLSAWKAAGCPKASRIYPHNPVSVGARYTRAKIALKIENLRFHDNRREAASRLFEAGFSVQEVMLVTGHKTPMMLLRVYTKLHAEDLHKGPAAKRGLEGKTFMPLWYQSHDILQEAKTSSAT